MSISDNRIEAAIPFDPERKRYYMLGVNHEYPARIEFTNRDGALINGRTGGDNKICLRDLDFHYYVGMPPVRERPKILVGTYDPVDPSPLDIYGDDKFFVSNRLKNLLCDIDPQAFEMIECEARDTLGEMLEPYWWIEVVRVLDAVDEDRSVLTRQTANPFSSGDPVDSVRYMDLQDIWIKTEVVKDYHVFKLTPEGRRSIVDETIADACRILNLRGVAFSPLQPPTLEERKWEYNFINYPYWNNKGYMA